MNQSAKAKNPLLGSKDVVSSPSFYQRLLSSARQVGLRHAKKMRNRTFLNAAATLVAGDRVEAPACNFTPPTQASNVEAMASVPASQLHNLGYERNIETKYDLGKQIGSGGYGTVKVAVQRETGAEFACKSVAKKLGPEAPDDKLKAHLKAIRNEVEVLTKLKGSLNVVKLEDVFEDETHVHIIMQLCKGGELHHRIGTRHYTERTVARYMRAVMRTLAQCHSHHILHRDIKPGNFMLLDESDDSPLIAIDFGLAALYEPEQLPRSDLGLEGTPWFMSPEVLNSQVTPCSDVWSAGVMAYQLLTGRMPFDDKRNPYSPGLTAIWRSILTDKLDFSKSYWSGISDEAKDFVGRLLVRDPAKRLTAKEALEHPWLQKGRGRSITAKPLGRSVVQRIQRFAQGSLFKQSVLRDMAAQLLLRRSKSKKTPAKPAPQADVSESIGDASNNSSSNGSVGKMLEKLNITGERVGTKDLEHSLKTAGAKMPTSDLCRLVSMVDLDADGEVERATLAASLIDWRQVQKANVDGWLDIAHHAFDAIDADGDGVITEADMEHQLCDQLPPAQMHAAVHAAFTEAGADPAAHMLDFDGFLHMLRSCSLDNLDIYDDRGSYGSRSSHSRSTSNHIDSVHSDTFDKVGSYVKAIRADDLLGPAPDAQPKPPRAVFNFDEKKQASAIQSPAAPKIVFRFEDQISAGTRERVRALSQMRFQFDDHGKGGIGTDREADKVVVGAVSGKDSAYASRRDGSGSGGRARPRGSNTCTKALYSKPGFQEKRMHGSSLYRNAALLKAVQE